MASDTVERAGLVDDEEGEGFGFAWRSLGLPQLGAAPAGRRKERMQASPNFEAGRVKNIVPTPMGKAADMIGASGEYLRRGVEREPRVALPVERPAPESLLPEGDEGLRVTWMGHSTLLLEVDGHLLLTDPVFSERVSPLSFAGPRRFHPTPLALSELPRLDAVLLSHDHFDHLDYRSVMALAERDLPFFVPLGVGAHLESWGIAPERITELDWWDEARLGTLRLVLAPARHFSGRSPDGRDRTLWGSWAVLGPRHRAWFSGDTGPFEQASEIGQRLGPFDLTMIEIGAFHPAWGGVHLGPDEALRMHQRVGGRVMMPVHWGTFNLAIHAWDQPIVRLQDIAEEAGVPLLAPVAGRTSSPASPEVAEFWQERRLLAKVEAWKER